MRKEFIYFISALGLFCIGFLLGKTQNDSGRYFVKDYSYAASVFDTRTGVSYFHASDTKKYYKVDIKNGTVEEYKEKK